MDEQRQQRIEERLAWLERHVLEQDRQMLAMAEQIDRQRKQQEELRERLRGGSSGTSEGEIFDGDERPPHY